MTNEQFQKLKKVVNETQPNIDHSGKEFVAKLLEQMGISVVSYIVHSKLWFSFVLTDLSVLSVLTDSKLGVRVKWVNKPKLVKQVIPETTTPTINTSSVKELMLVDYLKAGYRLGDVREVKILNNPDYEPDEFSNKVFKTKLEKHCTESNYFVMSNISFTAFNQEDIMVTDWQSQPLTGAGQESKFIPLEKWLETEPPFTINKAHIINTSIFSETVMLIENDKVLLDDRIIKYDISQIEVK